MAGTEERFKGRVSHMCSRHFQSLNFIHVRFVLMNTEKWSSAALSAERQEVNFDRRSNDEVKQPWKR